jgi:hypothetical protein
VTRNENSRGSNRTIIIMSVTSETTNNFEADYQRFMLGGGSPVISSTPTTSPQKSSNKKQYTSILKAFQGTLQRDWLEVDDNLGAVMRSISNLRERIYWASEVAAAKQEEEQSASQQQQRPTVGRVHLTRDDIELALEHDLDQHEQMMAGARSLLSTLNQAQEALGRRLDEALQETMDADDAGTLQTSMIAMEQIYQALARALYEKQVLVVHVLTCTNDSLLLLQGKNGKSVGLEQDDDPRKVAKACVDQWSKPPIQDIWSKYNA